MQITQFDIDRFESKVVKSEDSCWGWLGSFTTNGYGHFSVGGKFINAHRFSWLVNNGPIPPKMCVLHRCDNRYCTNPDHIFLGTQAENMADMDSKGRRRPSRGEAHGHAKLTERDALEILATVEASNGKRGIKSAMAKKYGVHHTSIRDLVNGKNWRHLFDNPKPRLTNSTPPDRICIP